MTEQTEHNRAIDAVKGSSLNDIRIALSNQRAELRGKVEALKKKNPNVRFEDGMRMKIYHNDREYYNQAIQDVIALLAEKESHD